ncbi:hypothetical protein DC083_01105 [Ignatzschineria ureiclastica]|uniref:Uncharacterized protein n=1 Tax=Ignatzschineria ureiclastica TaxID=472582 RepID=A0A2U2AGP8_9GAMM|nr:hypothetical protein [Ignatzschineria ureiclastica]PWD81822.1 hypothetical protein DC083_01105 [Ignatzschineria ureiclastica]
MNKKIYRIAGGNDCVLFAIVCRQLWHLSMPELSPFVPMNNRLRSREIALLRALGFSGCAIVLSRTG